MFSYDQSAGPYGKQSGLSEALLVTVFGQNDHATDVYTGLSVAVKWTLLTDYVLVYVCVCVGCRQ